MTAGRKPPNIVLVMSDEHDPHVAGCYGDRLARTPNLDRLAAEGCLFDRAYCNSPMCLPSRMSFLTGQYAHRIRCWDNGSHLPEDAETMAHRLSRAGYETVLCGRMHLLGEDRLRGFDRRLVDDRPEWVVNQKHPKRTPAARRGSNSHVAECGPGEGSHQAYDREVTDAAVRFLQEKASQPADKPWLLVVGLMFPHFPLIAPPEYYAMYDPQKMPLPDLRGETLDTLHPVIRQLRYFFRNDEELPEALLRQALASYYALVTLTDDHVGSMMAEVDHSPLRNDTAFIYVSDHGEMAGKHGIWQKQCFYESSVRVPMIMRLPGESGGKRIRSAVSLADLLPTLMELAGLPLERKLDGASLMELIHGGERPDRTVFSEYHAQGMLNAGYMVVRGDWKYNEYVGHRPQLFHIGEDPGEFADLYGNPDYAPIAAEMMRLLHGIVDPVETDRLAKADQRG